MYRQPPVVSARWTEPPCPHGGDGRALNSRRGFTMMELLLALAIVIVVCAITWTATIHAYDGIRLKRAGEQVMTAFGHARVVAMSKGLTQVFRCQPNTPRYTLDALPDDSDPTAGDGSG